MIKLFDLNTFTYPTTFSQPKDAWDVADSLLHGGIYPTLIAGAYLGKNIIRRAVLDIPFFNTMPGFFKTRVLGELDTLSELGINIVRDTVMRAVAQMHVTDSKLGSLTEINPLKYDLLIPNYPFYGITNPHKNITASQYFNFYFKSLKPSYWKKDNNKSIIGVIKFNPIITNFSETYSPNWEEKDILGHVFGIHNYKKTTRVINLDFDLYAFERSEMLFNIERLNWLADHAYGGLESISKFTEDENKASAFTQEVNFKEFPFIEATIGEVIREQPCYMTNLTFNYDVSPDAVWDLDEQHPHKISISLSLNVLYKDKHLNDKRFYGEGLRANTSWITRTLDKVFKVKND